MFQARVVERRGLEFRTRAVTYRAGFLTVWYAAASRPVDITTLGTDDRALQVTNLAGLGLEVSNGRRAGVTNAAGCCVRRRGNVVRPDPDVRSLVGADCPGRRTSHVVTAFRMASVAVRDALRVGNTGERATLIGCARGVNRVNHITHVVAFLRFAIRA